MPASLLAGTSRGVSFRDATAAAGIELSNLSGGNDREKWTILETTGAGACLLDAEGDGDLDLYLVNGGTLAGLADRGKAPPSDALYLNDGGGRFKDGTAAAGIAESAWGGGCAAADVDNDGDTDLYVTNFGADVLYLNDGQGRFRDATAAAGLARADHLWSNYSLGAAFFDADADGDLDLYVAKYVVFSPVEAAATARRCRFKSGEVMCGPRGFTGQSDVFYRNRGDGTFEDVSAAAGVKDALYGMGVVAGDLDGDGDSDLFVANDSQQNLLLIGDGQGHFRDAALEAGVALSGDGRSQAGMGADLGDYDGDGDEDLLVTNFSDDYHSLYRNDGDLLFTDVSGPAGLDPATRFAVGWGGGFFDFDNDGDLDIFFANGHVYPGIENFDAGTSFRQRNQLFENDGRGIFRETRGEAGAALEVAGTGRGVAIGDLDNDGDLDLLVVNSDALPVLLKNEGGNRLHWSRIALRGRQSPRDGIGTRLLLTAGGRRQLREARRGGGYLSSSDPRVHFGIGEARQVEKLELRWPSGKRQVLENLPADCDLAIDEELGLVAKVCRGAAGPVPAAAAASAFPLAPVAPAASAPFPPAAPAAAMTAAPIEREVVLREAQAATRLVLAGLYGRAIAAFEALLAKLPPWPAAGASESAFAASTEAYGFGRAEDYRAFLASVTDNLGVAYLRAERFEDGAAAARRAIELEPSRSKSYHNLGISLYHARRYGESIAALRQAAALPSPSAGLHFDLGRALAAAGPCAAAEAELTAALAELPRPDPRGRDAEILYLRGGCRSDNDRLEEAEADLREALSRVPGHQKSLFKLATVYTKRGDRAAAARARALFLARQARDEAAQLLKRDGGRDRNERLQLAEAYLDAGQPQQALQEAQSLIEANPRDPAAFTLLGEARLRLTPPALGPAGEAFVQALESDPSQPRAKLGLELAQAMEKIGNGGAEAAGAATQLRRLAAENPGDARLREQLAAALLAGSAAADPAPAGKAAEALALASGLDRHFGAGDRLRLRALLLLGRLEEARGLAGESFFLTAADRAAIPAQRIEKQ